VYAPLRRMAAAYHDRQAAEAVVPTLERRDAPTLLPAPRLGKSPAVSFRGVDIAYGDAPPFVSGFDLKIRPGQVIALTGASGTGKSSLLHLFLGLSPLSAGEV
ncbi:MAG TPA: thiol reductant ABC exporter subunit CydD, partial [Brevundimonas sp.]|nr:thiol reductant ABC exporter subunit CydD [Brevundimonas sp.]